MRTPSLDIGSRRGLWIAVGLTVLTLSMFLLRAFIGTLVVALFVYYGTRPFYRRILLLVKNRTLAAGSALLTVSLPVIFLVLYTTSIGYRELTRFLGSHTEESISDVLEPFVDADVVATISSVIQSPQQAFADGLTQGTASSIFDILVGSTVFIGSFAIHLLIVLVLAFYLLRDGYKIKRWVFDIFDLENTLTAQYFYRVDLDFHRIFFGNLLNAVITGLIAAIVFSLINIGAPANYAIPYPTLLGLLCGITSLIPVVGMKLVYVPATAFIIARMALLQDITDLFWFPLVFAATSFVVVDTIPDFILRPYISGRDIHVGALMLAYIIGPLFFGWYGLFFAPMILVFVFHYAQVILPSIIHPEPTEQTKLSKFGKKEL